MNTKLFTAGACIAWAAVAVSSAAPANARAASMQSADYAACSNHYESASSSYACSGGEYEFTYYQEIHFVTTRCNSATGCVPNLGSTYTDQVYTTGRKIVSLMDSGCGMFGATSIYGLGTCAC
jgi:hypothetical protein